MRAPFRACNTSGMSAAQPAGWAWTQAVQAWRRRRNNAAMGMAGPSVMTTGIWAATAIGSGNIYFFWPVFVILGTGMNVLRTMFSKQDIIESERDRIERKARNATPGGPGPAGR